MLCTKNIVHSKSSCRTIPCGSVLKFRKSLRPKHLQIQLLHLRSRPGRSAQELQTGFDAGVVREAADGDGLAHRFPAEFFGQLRDDHLKGDTLKRWTFRVHVLILQER